MIVGMGTNSKPKTDEKCFEKEQELKRGNCFSKHDNFCQPSATNTFKKNLKDIQQRTNGHFRQGSRDQKPKVQFEGY